MAIYLVDTLENFMKKEDDKTEEKTPNFENVTIDDLNEKKSDEGKNILGLPSLDEPYFVEPGEEKVYLSSKGNKRPKLRGIEKSMLRGKEGYWLEKRSKHKKGPSLDR